MQGINDLGFPTINGLKSLNLDELDTTILNANTIDGNIIYYNRIEGNEIIVDTKLTLTNTGVIAVGDKFISDIELTYLDGVSSNIQKQIDNIAGQDLQFQAQIDNHTNQIEDLQNTDITHSNQIEILQNADTTHSSQIENLQISDTNQNTEIDNLNYEVNQHDITLTAQETEITNLKNKTIFQTANSTATIFSKQINIPNGNIGFVNSLYPNNFYIQSNLLSGNNIYLNSGVANTYLQSQNVYLGKTDATTGRKSNLLMLGSDGTTWETQSSAFTETHKSLINTHTNQITLLQEDFLDLQNTDSAQSAQLASLQISDTTQNTRIAFQTLQIDELYVINTALYNKTQNIASSTTSAQTLMTKPLYISSGDGLRLYGTFGFISGWDSVVPNTRDWYIGTPTSNNKQFRIVNEKQEGIYLRTGSRSGNINLGQNKIVTHSNGISLRRGGITAGDTEVIVGEIGATSTADSHLYINGNSTNSIYINSGIGGTNLVTNIVWIGSGTANANGRKSNINMLDATGNTWETQSSAFTETLKSQVINATSNYTTINAKFTDASSFWVKGKYKNAIISNMTIGLADPLPASSNYNNTSDYPNYFNAGLYFFQTGLTTIFSNTGRFLPSTPMRFNVSVEMEFDTYLGGVPSSGSTGVGIRILESRLRINSFGAEIDGTYYSGLNLSGYISSNKYVRYRLTINHIFNYGDEIILQTYYDINTGTNTYTGAIMRAMFILERQVL